MNSKCGKKKWENLRIDKMKTSLKTAKQRVGKVKKNSNKEEKEKFYRDQIKAAS